MPIVEGRPLAEWPEKTDVRVSRVRTHDPEKLRYLASVRLVPGSELTITNRSPFNGPAHVTCARNSFVLSSELAGELYVEHL
ncbi:MAG: ferrous iron transport protein A [Chloroflexi bacterium]|nr:ferrous iron transport protein A [Chloroflexota bacterium]